MKHGAMEDVSECAIMRVLVRCSEQEDVNSDKDDQVEKLNIVPFVLCWGKEIYQTKWVFERM
jgi:hypothetical protein